MKYLYTTKPDEGCHRINGVYGRPVHTSEQKSLKAKGWKENPDELREEEGREEAEVGETFANEVVRQYEEESEEATKSFTLKDMEGYANRYAKERAFSDDDREALSELYEEKFGKSLTTRPS